jgi:dihydroorotase
MYDLIIKGGRVIDPAQEIDKKADVAVSGNKIAALSADIPASDSKQAIDASGKVVTPGLIDLHCHVYRHVVRNGVDPDEAGVKQGVTTVVDAGSAGEAIFSGLPAYVIPACRTTVYCFLNLASQGQSLGPELMDRREVNTEAMASIIESHPDIIRGVKVRLTGGLAATIGSEIVTIAKKIAGRFSLPIMVHIGDRENQVAPDLTKEILPLMEAGDIVSHIYTAQRGCILLPDGRVMPEAQKAKVRGVIMDVANGRNNFNYEVARQALDQDIPPFTISSDLTVQSLAGPVYGLTVSMSRFLALDVELKKVIEMTTINPARALGIEDRKGSLAPGWDADISILEMASGLWELADASQNALKLQKLIEPRVIVKAGEVIPSEPVARPKLLD